MDERAGVQGSRVGWREGGKWEEQLLSGRIGQTRGGTHSERGKLEAL